MKRWMLALAALCAVAVPVQAQNTGRITGIVTGDGGIPVPQAYVAVVGIPRSAVADSLGRYLITDVPVGPRTVRARLVGYTPLTLRATVIAGQTITLNFTLGSSAVQLEGMTVVAYGEQERRDIVGSVASVPMERISEVPTINAAQAIQSKVAGVDVVGSNYRPGASMNVRIRGVRSMVATNEPLYVVDGIPLAGGIEDFDPANIESIEVLKDASATAVYGSRGANGVVLVSTRRGGTGTGSGTRITYDGQFGFQNPLHLVPMMNSQQYAAAKTAAWLAAARDTSFTNLWPDPLEQFGMQNGVSTDWQQLILRTGRQQRHQLGINTISGNTRLSLTGSYFNQAGITLGQGYQLYSGTASLDHTTGPLHVGLTATGTRAHTDVGMGDGLWGQTLAMSPLGLAYDSLGLLKWKPTADPLLVNPLIEVPGYIRQLDRNRLFGSFFAELQITKDLSWRTNFGPDISNNEDGRFRGALTIDRNGTSPDAYFERQQTFAYTFDNLLRFNRQFGTQHRVEATLLYSVQHSKYTMNHAESSNLPYDQQLWYNLGTGQVVGPVSSDFRQTALAGYMARVNYALADKYLLTVTGRYDGSSLLAPGHKWSFFPSVGLGWQVGDEPFFRRSPLGRAFSSLKLRGSWGVSGNTSLAPYQTQGSLAYTRYAFAGAAAFGYQPNGIPNPDLKWEKTASTNVGVDFGVFANRITGSLDVYRENTYDLMMYRQLPPTSGFTQTLANIGKTANQGWEFNLSTVNIPGRAGSLRWTTDISLTHNKNWIVSLYGKNLDDTGNRWFIGQPINVGGAVAPPAGSGATVATTYNADALRNVFYDYKMLGIWQLADSALAASYGQRPGDIRVQDINGDGRITAADRFIQGNTYPKLLGSVYNRVSLGHFDASVLLTFRLGYTIYDGFGVGNSVLAGRYNNLVVDYWTPENCPLNDPRSLTAACNTNPRPNGNREDPQYSTTRGYLSAGHARIRNITVGYTFPTSVARYFRMSSLRLYMQALDPFLFSNYHGYDPEAGTAGSPPSYRTVVFGTTVGF